MFEGLFTNNNTNEEPVRENIQQEEVPVINSYYNHNDHEQQEQNNNLSNDKRIIPITINEIFSDSNDDEYEIFQKKVPLTINEIIYNTYTADNDYCIVDTDDENDDTDSESGLEEDTVLTSSIKYPKLFEFNIMNHIDRLIKTMVFNIEQSNTRDVSHLYSVGLIKSDYSTDELQAWSSSANVSTSDRKSLLQLLCRHIPIIQDSVYTLKKNMEYQNSCKMFLEFDCCDNGCMVYAGENEGVLFCQACKSKLTRFLPCAQCIRDHNPNGGMNRETLCSHNNTNQIPRRTIRYRSIKLLLIELIQFESFREVLKYQFAKEDNNIYQSSLDGESHIRNLQEMKDQFDLYSQSSLGGTDIEPIYITGSWFYDGTQVFKTVTSEMAPIFISFQNLPHNLRTENGAGSFLISLMTFKKGGPVEDFIMNDCFVAELKELAKGFEITIENKRYFVLFHLICHIQDLMGFNGVLKVQNMAKSKEGCIFCNCGHGRSINFGKTKKAECKYDGTRQYLSIRHPTRTNGFSRQCCPKDYYETHNSKHQILNQGNSSRVPDFAENQIRFEDLTLCIPNKDLQKKLKDFLNPKQQFQCPYNWFDDNSNYDHFKPYLLWYPHCCYKPRIEYERTTNEMLFDRTEEALNTGMPYKGVKGVWCFGQVKNVRVDTDVAPSDIKHDLKAIMVDQMKLLKCPTDSRAYLKGNEDMKEKLKSEQKKQTYESLVNKTDLPPWGMQEKEQLIAEAYIRCILSPDRSVEMPPIFRQTGNLKIAQLIKVFTTLLNLVLLAAKTMRFAYKQLHRMFAGIVNRIQAPKLPKRDVNPLCWRSREWLSLSEGLYPVTEMTIMKHFIPDVILHIPNQGPIHTFHTLFGETLVGKSKRKIKRNGGIKIENDAFDKIIEAENINMKSTYGCDLPNMMKTGKHTDYHSLYYDTDNKSFKADYNRNEIFQQNKSHNGDSLNSFEIDEIIKIILKSLLAKFVLPNQVILNSSFYRVIMFVKAIINDNNNETIMSALERAYEEIVRSNQTEKIKVLKKEYNNYDLSIIEAVNNGFLIESDIPVLSEIYEKFIKTFKYKLFALANGIKIKGRGFLYSQKTRNKIENTSKKRKIDQQDVQPVDNPKYEHLKNHWSEKNQYNSWCKLKNCYSQINYVFSIDIRNDLYVSNLQIASVTSVSTIYPEFLINYDLASGPKLNEEKLPLNHVNLNDKTVIDDELPLFVIFDEILPTKVAVIGFCQRGNSFFPIDCLLNGDTDESLYKYGKSTAQSKLGTPTNNPIIATFGDKYFKIDLLGLIDLSPENVVQPEKQEIFNQIEWMDEIWDEEAEDAYIKLNTLKK